MTEDILTITEVDHMLALLRVDPASRMITYIEGEPWLNLIPYMVETGAHGRIKQYIACIGTGPADDLCEAAIKADSDGDQAQWAALPIRYGPFCNFLCLAESPRAPVQCGTVNDQEDNQ